MKKFSPVIALLMFLAVISLAYSIQHMKEAKDKPVNELLYFPTGRFIEQISMEYRGIVADFLWLQTIQYYGAHMLTDRQVTYLYRLFDVITKLDPSFQQCYVFGSTIITYDQKEPSLGMQLLDKGMTNMPDSWQIPFIKGFLNYMYTRNYEEAYLWFRFAASKPEAPSYCRTFAAASLSKQGDYITALELWSRLYSEDANKYNMQRAENNIIVILTKEFNEKKRSMPYNEFAKYVKNEIEKYTFLPFSVNIRFMADSVIVERL